MYSQGYAGTSINQVIDESSSHKASFYRYFQTKEELGFEYLKQQGDDFRNSWIRLMNSSETPQEFVRRWMALLRKQTKSGKFFGCPLARFMSSLDQPDVELANRSASVLESWLECLSDYFASCKQKGLVPDYFNPRKKAELFMKLFQGNSQLYMITHNRKYFEEMETEMLGELER
ncbi:TetR family transcriptional regulator [Leptospira perolatii]|uniref:TetR family transcriptional regulator n=2 Tax=Leptospira perolatii TaxID=2023191 RepID=A0A2M9ZKH6_9LEPT|nr:TetR family transcriptional regulator [Leptospira perolatii]PJZ72570.1 TetR family transcriptional regulator [Leptospira perolatii]